MFNKKQTATKVTAKSKAGVSATNPFVNAGMKKSSETLSGNGALKYSTTGNPFVDQFGKMGGWKAPRAFNEICNDFGLLWAENPLDAVKFTLFLRTIPRKVNLPDGTSTENPQKGAELKHESIMRMIWLAIRQPQAFWNNILLFVSLGSWHDVFKMLETDLVYNGWAGRKLDWNKFGDLILAALQNKNVSELVKKYLPQIRANSACKTIEAQSNNAIAKWLCSLIFGVKNGSHAYYGQYRRLKSSGTAHEWQKLISQGRFKELDFDKIHGRALSILVKSQFLKKTGLSDKYAKWVAKPTTQVKYTGFVHELFEGGVSSYSSKHVLDTVDKQFQTLVEKARANEVTSLIVVRDTSGSMGATATGTNSTCYNIAKGLALYFSEFLQGSFANSWIEFNSSAKMHTWNGSTPTAKWFNDKSSYIGSTNFLSVIDLFISIKKSGVAEADFPKGILCISDSEFNPAQLGKTNVESAKSKLSAAGFSSDYVDNFIIVLWNLQSYDYGPKTGQKFETYGDVPNVYYFSGYSGSIISFLCGEKIKTAADVVEAALNQEVLNMVSLEAPKEKLPKKKTATKKVPAKKVPAKKAIVCKKAAQKSSRKK